MESYGYGTNLNHAGANQPFFKIMPSEPLTTENQIKLVRRIQTDLKKESDRSKNPTAKIDIEAQIEGLDSVLKSLREYDNLRIALRAAVL